MQSAAGTSFAWIGVVDDDATENDLFRIQTIYLYSTSSRFAIQLKTMHQPCWIPVFKGNAREWAAQNGINDLKSSENEIGDISSFTAPFCRAFWKGNEN